MRWEVRGSNPLISINNREELPDMKNFDMKNSDIKKSDMKQLLKQIIPNNSKVFDMLKEKNSQYLIIVESNGIIETCSKVKNPMEIIELHSQMMDKSPSVARLKSVEKMLKNMRSNNKQTYLGSPTLNDDELAEIDTIILQIDDIIKRSCSRWQVEKPKSPFEKESPELSQKLKESKTLKTPTAKPYMKIVK